MEDARSGDVRTLDYVREFAVIHDISGTHRVPEHRVREFTEADGARWSFEYLGVRGSQPVQTRVLDGRRIPTLYGMNGYGAVTSIEDPAGTRSTVWDMTALKPASSTDRLGQVTESRYDAFGNRLSERITGPGAAGTIERFWTYRDASTFSAPFIRNRVHTASDGRGTVTQTSYDANGWPRTVTRGGVTETTVHAANGDLRSSTNGAGETVTFSYDDHGWPLAQVGPLGATIQFQHDAVGRVIASTDPEGRTQTTRYDGLDRLTQVADNLGVIQAATCDDRAHKSTTRDARGQTTVTTTDAMGRRLQIDRPEFAGERFTYDAVGNLTSERDSRGAITTHSYDDANRRIQTDAPEGKSTTFTHDAEGHVLTETTTGLGGTRSVTRQYDHPLYTVTHEDLGDGVVRRSEYDANGNLTRQIDARNNAITQVFDARDRLTQKTEPSGRTTTWTYDGADRSTAQIHSGGWRRDFSYNALGQLITERDSLGQTTTHSYNKRGDLLSTTDRTGATITSTYDLRGRKTAQSGPTPSQSQAMTYDPADNLLTHRLESGQLLTTTYDGLNRPTQAQDQLGTLWTRTYDANGNLTAQTDGNGQQTTFQYNLLNQKTQQSAPENRVTAWTYTVWGEPLSQTLPEGGVTTHQYDAQGRNVRTTYPLIAGQVESAYETRTYDANGNITAQRDADGNVTTFAYDNANRKTAQTDPAPLSFPQTWTYDSENNLLSHTDRNAKVTAYTYDSENRKRTTTRDGLTRERLTYDGEGRITERTDPENRTTRLTLDAAGRVTITTTPTGIQRSATYTPAGDVATADNGEGQINHYQYDIRRRKTSETNPQSETTRFAYDNASNLRQTIAPQFTGDAPAFGVGCNAPTGQDTFITTLCYDNANRLSHVIDANGDQTSYDYDRNDNLIAVLEPGNKKSEFQYDARNRRVRKKSADLATGPPQIWTWTYDGTGDVVDEADPSSAVSTHSYDALNRPTSTAIENAPVGSPSQQSVQYDANGNITQRSETNGSQTYALSFLYDAFNRPYQITDSNGRVWRQTFDAADERITLDSNGIPRVSWNYDANGRPVEIVVEGAGAFQLAYDKADRNTTITNPNGVVTTHQFDATGRITEINHTRNGGTIAKFQYRYDANGNRIEQIEQNGGATSTTTFDYDQADRLIAITEPTKHTEYSLDANGNRMETKEGPSAGQVAKRLVSTFDARNQIINQKEYNGTGILVATTAFDFDANGNLVRQSQGAAQTQWRYDMLDRLIETTPPTGPPTQYRYGPGDVRIATIRAGMEIRHHYDGERLILETNVLDNPIRHYAYSSAGLLSTTVLGSSPQYRYAHLDAQTSPIAITASNGNILNRSHFDAYGVETNLYGTRDQAISFQGYWSGIELEETGNLLSAARLYIPGLGIYGERDPVEGTTNQPITFNPYLIGRSNPQRWLDPDGRCAAATLVPFGGDYCTYKMVEQYHGSAEADRVLEQSYPNASRAIGAAQFAGSTAKGLAIAPFALAGAVGGTALEYAGLREGHASSDALGSLIAGGVDTTANIYDKGLIDYGRERLWDRVAAFQDAGTEGRFVDQGHIAAEITTTGAGALAGAAGFARSAASMTEKALAKVSRPGSDVRTLAPSEAGLSVDSCPFGQCFVAGTPVLTISGLKPIETIDPGDLIASRNEITGETRYRRVEKVIITQDREVIDLDFRDAGAGTTERITATPNHPFHTPDSAWVEAGSLKIGQAISSHDGRTLTLAARSEHPSGETTYNFTVEKDHTYFVGTSGLWVHNSGGCKACPTAAVNQYLQSVRSFPTPQNSKANLFEIEQAGPLNYRIPSGSETLDIDGFDGSTIIDAKYVENPDRSPYIPDSKMSAFLREKITKDQMNELRRAKAILEDPSIPFDGFEIRTNDSRAAVFFNQLMERAGMDARAVVVPTKVGG